MLRKLPGIDIPVLEVQAARGKVVAQPRGGVATRDHPEQCLAALQRPSRAHGPPFGGVWLPGHSRRAQELYAMQLRCSAGDGGQGGVVISILRGGTGLCAS